MHSFEYASPKTLKEATALLGSSWGDAAVLAGGTDLINLMKDELMQPKRVVNVKEIAELKGIAARGKDLRIGAAATVDELVDNAVVRKSFPSLASAARGITSPQIRNMGTVGGDLCQRPRCWYYRNGFGLLGMQNGRSMVEAGDNRYHAIFGSGPAKFVSASSFGPALIALGARVKLVSATGSREVEAEKFFVAPANDQAREVALLPNEILTEILVPMGAMANATYEVRQKDALDWPLVTASVAIKGAGGKAGSGRIVLGHVAPTPWVAADAEKMLAGKSMNAETAAAVAEAAAAGANPLSDNRYKVTLVKTAVKRALLEAFGVKQASAA